jgi:hypothetical protein
MRPARCTLDLCTLALALVASSLAACGDDTSSKPACKLVAGDLVITEVMYNPKGDEGSREWFEIYNTTATEQILNGLVLKAGSATNPKTTKVSAGLDPKIAAGAYLVVGNSTLGSDAGTPMKLGFSWPQLTLSNTGATIVLECGSTVVDTLTYGTSSTGWPSATEGATIQLSGGKTPDATDNDTAANWCLSSDAQAYDADGNKGTPGAANGTCAIAGQCTSGGSSRAAVPPTTSSLVLTEVLADTAGADDPNKEWIEGYALADFDLNDVVVVHSTTSSKKSYTVKSTSCVSVTSGSYFVLGGSTDTSKNGGVTVTYAFSSGLTLYNSAAKLELQDSKGNVLATANPPAPTATGGGTSVQLDHSKEQDTSAPATATNWCDSKTTGKFDGTGTPGSANDSCI